MNTETKEIYVGEKIKIGGTQPLFLFGGPCVLESQEHAVGLAKEISGVCQSLGIPYVFKASYDKANRSSLDSYRGPGYPEGLQVLDNIKNKLGIPVLSDVHETTQVEKAAQVLDILQIPAFLCRQTDLLVEAARTGKPINIKKGPFLAPHDMKNIVEKVRRQGNDNIILTERGTSFGYNNLVFDVRSIPIMKDFGFPVVIDASHSVQKPGGQGVRSGGESKFIPQIAAAGIAAGSDGVFLEIHNDPPNALSDGPNSLNINNLHDLLSFLLRIKEAVRTENKSQNNSGKLE